MTVLRLSWLIARKDLRIETRSKLPLGFIPSYCRNSRPALNPQYDATASARRHF